MTKGVGIRGSCVARKLHIGHGHRSRSRAYLISPRLRSFLVVALTGLMEMVSAVIGYFTASYIEMMIGLGLAFAAGAMMFIVYKELIPESHGHGFERSSTYSFIFGLLLMVNISYIFS